MNDYDTYTEDGINKGKDYKYTAKEYGELDSNNERWIIRTILEPEETIVKKFYIALKANNKGSAIRIDAATGMRYADHTHIKGGLFVGTEKELNNYCKELIKQGIYIQDIYDYEKED